MDLKRISSYKSFPSRLKKELEAAHKAGVSNHEFICKRVIEYLKNTRNIKHFVALLGFVADRIEGKPVSTELHGSLADNPLADYDTSTLQRRLNEIENEKSGRTKRRTEIPPPAGDLKKTGEGEDSVFHA